MDLSAFDSREKADEGVVFPLVITGETVFGDDDEPVTFSIRGANAPEVQQYFISIRKQGEPASPAEVVERDMKLMKLAVNGWSDNFTVDGEKHKFSTANIAKVCSAPAVRTFIASKIISERAFMKGS